MPFKRKTKQCKVSLHGHVPLILPQFWFHKKVNICEFRKLSTVTLFITTGYLRKQSKNWVRSVATVVLLCISRVSYNTLQYYHNTVYMNNHKVIWIHACCQDILHVCVFIVQRGRLGVCLGVGWFVKAREHLPPSHYYAVSSRETEGI